MDNILFMNIACIVALLIIVALVKQQLIAFAVTVLGIGLSLFLFCNGKTSSQHIQHVMSLALMTMALAIAAKAPIDVHAVAVGQQKQAAREMRAFLAAGLIASIVVLAWANYGASVPLPLSFLKAPNVSLWVALVWLAILALWLGHVISISTWTVLIAVFCLLAVTNAMPCCGRSHALLWPLVRTGSIVSLYFVLSDLHFFAIRV
jgi:hypothetical protein